MIVVERLRWRERWVDWLAAAAIVSVAFALAGLVWRIAGHAGTGAITVPSEARTRAVTVDTGPAVAWQPFGSPTAADATSPTAIQAVLKGVVFARPAELSVAFVSIGNEPAKPFKPGDALVYRVSEGQLSLLSQTTLTRESAQDGALAPPLVAKDRKGRLYRLADALLKRPVVIVLWSAGSPNWR